MRSLTLLGCLVVAFVFAVIFVVGFYVVVVVCNGLLWVVEDDGGCGCGCADGFGFNFGF